MSRTLGGLRIGALWLTAVLGCGCGATVVRSGLPPGKAASGYDQRWHAALVFGAIPVRRRYELERICPRGWAEVRSEVDFFTGLVGVATLFVYTPSRLTIVCAARPDRGPPPLQSYPVPQR